MSYICSFVRSEMGMLLIMDERTFSRRTVIHWMLGCLSIGKKRLSWTTDARAYVDVIHSFVLSYGGMLLIMDERTFLMDNSHPLVSLGQ